MPAFNASGTIHILLKYANDTHQKDKNKPLKPTAVPNGPKLRFLAWSFGGPGTVGNDHHPHGCVLLPGINERQELKQPFIHTFININTN
jgi:hypothetical protein